MHLKHIVRVDSAHVLVAERRRKQEVAKAAEPVRRSAESKRVAASPIGESACRGDLTGHQPSVFTECNIDDVLYHNVRHIFVRNTACLEHAEACLQRSHFDGSCLPEYFREHKR